MEVAVQPDVQLLGKSPLEVGIVTYEPLHHKYRPQTFGQLVGQEAIATTLTSALRQQRIAPAYLFTGARGTGKTSSARIFAKSLNCLGSETPTPTPCGTCEVCRAIAGGSALDVIEIDAASNTGVDNIRELIERAQFAPVQCRYKVYVVDECHMLSTSAFNALLKTLEEPPDRVVFVLATTDPQRVLPTIISRCQRFDFRRIPLEAMVQHLQAIAAKEAIDITTEAVQLIAQIAQGGLRDAESLLDQLSLLTGQITVEGVWDLVGAVPERDLLSLVEAIAQNDPVAVLDRARHLMDRGREPLIVLQNLAGFYRDMLIAKTAPDRNDLVAITAPTWEKLCAFVQTLDLGTILAGQQHLRASEIQVKNTTQPRLWLEVTLLGLLPAELNRQSVPPPPTISAPKPGATNGSAPPVLPPVTPPPVEPTVVPPPLVDSPPAPPPPAETPVVPPPADPRTVQQSATPTEAPEFAQVWQQVILKLPPLTKGLLRDNGRLLSVKQQEVSIGVPPALIKAANKQLKHIETGFGIVLGRPVRVVVEALVATEEPPNAAPEPPISPAYSPSPEPSPPPPPIMPAAIPVAAPVSEAASQPVARSEEPQPVTPAAPQLQSWEEDEVTKAAKRLAEFFGGKIVDVDGFSTGGDAPALIEAPDEPDVPF